MDKLRHTEANWPAQFTILVAAILGCPIIFHTQNKTQLILKMNKFFTCCKEYIPENF